jgi:FAD:protein FMN transferase
VIKPQMATHLDPRPDRPSLVTHAEAAMGTVFSLSVRPGGVSGPELRSALGAACATLHHADAIFSTWDRQSPVSRLRRGEACLVDLPREVAQVVAECQAARRASGGWFDPWAMPGGFDPTGLAKGWAAEQDLAAFGSPAPGRRWRVGIRHPWSAGSLAGVIEVEAAVATSGSYERGPHLIDPATGLASGRAASATVTGPSLAMADALATAVAVGGDEALAVVGGVEGYAAYLIRPDGSETGTGGITFVS